MDGIYDTSIIQGRGKFELVLKLFDHFWLNTFAAAFVHC